MLSREHQVTCWPQSRCWRGAGAWGCLLGPELSVTRVDTKDRSFLAAAELDLPVVAGGGRDF